jgi:hypothetical protein
MNRDERQHGWASIKMDPVDWIKLLGKAVHLTYWFQTFTDAWQEMER